MNISLTPELEEFVESRVKSGHYQTTSEVMRAGLRLLIEEKVIAPSDRVACILTGHALKDANVTMDYHRRAGAGSNAQYANSPRQTDASIENIAELLGA